MASDGKYSQQGETKQTTIAEVTTQATTKSLSITALQQHRPSFFVQSELIPKDLRDQTLCSNLRGNLEKHWLMIYAYLDLSFADRLELRWMCRLFHKVEVNLTLNKHCYAKMLAPIPKYTWFPHPNYKWLGGLVARVNEVVEESPDNAPQLLFLDFRYLDWEDDERDYYESLSGACVVVDETGCFRLTGDNITDDDVMRMAREHSNLHSLNLAGCSNITDASVMEVARRCSKLQSLNIMRCSNITDASVMEVARGCSNLQTLNLRNCSNITDASVMEVARGCSNLQTLDLICCSNITDACMMEVARRCSNLQLLDLYPQSLLNSSIVFGCSDYGPSTCQNCETDFWGRCDTCRDEATTCDVIECGNGPCCGGDYVDCEYCHSTVCEDCQVSCPGFTTSCLNISPYTGVQVCGKTVCTNCFGNFGPQVCDECNNTIYDLQYYNFKVQVRGEDLGGLPW
jgi:hypothetical protein